MKFLVVLSALATVALAQYGQIATLCGQYQTYESSGYIFNNNLWGEGGASGQQCTYVFDASSSGVAWTTTWTWSGGSGVKSYANSGLEVSTGQLLSSIGSMPSQASWSYSDTSITADVAYDLFSASDPNHSTSSGDYELMIWLAAYGGQQPVGNAIDSTTIGGIHWTLWYGYAISTQQTYSFVPDSPVTDFDGDVKQFWDYLASNHGYPAGSQYLLTFQFGTEPISGGQTTLSVSSFSASVN